MKNNDSGYDNDKIYNYWGGWGIIYMIGGKLKKTTIKLACLRAGSHGEGYHAPCIMPRGAV